MFQGHEKMRSNNISTLVNKTMFGKTCNYVILLKANILQMELEAFDWDGVVVRHFNGD